MTYEVTNSRKGTSIVRAEGPATYTIQLTDLSASAQETITSASLRRITWSTNGSITISRTGGPTLLSLYQTGDMKFDGETFLGRLWIFFPIFSTRTMLKFRQLTTSFTH